MYTVQCTLYIVNWTVYTNETGSHNSKNNDINIYLGTIYIVLGTIRENLGKPSDITFRFLIFFLKTSFYPSLNILDLYYSIYIIQYMYLYLQPLLTSTLSVHLLLLENLQSHIPVYLQPSLLCVPLTSALLYTVRFRLQYSVQCTGPFMAPTIHCN